VDGGYADATIRVTYCGPVTGAVGRTYDMSPDGRRFLVVTSRSRAQRTAFVQNFKRN
jgi:hypothetical protein